MAPDFLLRMLQETLSSVAVGPNKAVEAEPVHAVGSSAQMALSVLPQASTLKDCRLKMKIRSLEEALQFAKRDISSLTTQKSRLEATVAAQLSDAVRLNAKLAKESAAATKRRVKTLEAELQAAKREISSLKSQKGKLETEIAEMSADAMHEKLATKTKEAARKRVQLEVHNSAIAAQKTLLEERLADITMKLGESEKAVEATRAQLQTATDDAAALRLELQRARTAHDELQKRADEARSALTDSQARVSKLEGRLYAAVTARDRVRASSALARGALRRSQSQVQSLDRAQDAQGDALGDRVRELESEKVVLADAMKMLLEDNACLREKLAVHEARAAGAEASPDGSKDEPLVSESTRDKIDTGPGLERVLDSNEDDQGCLEDREPSPSPLRLRALDETTGKQEAGDPFQLSPEVMQTYPAMYISQTIKSPSCWHLNFGNQLLTPG